MLTRNPSIVVASRPKRTRAAAEGAPKPDALAAIVRQSKKALAEPAAPPTKPAHRLQPPGEPMDHAELRAAADRVWARVNGRR